MERCFASVPIRYSEPAAHGTAVSERHWSYSVAGGSGDLIEPPEAPSAIIGAQKYVEISTCSEKGSRLYLMVSCRQLTKGSLWGIPGEPAGLEGQVAGTGPKNESDTKSTERTAKSN